MSNPAGSDGTGQAILPQLRGLTAAGYDVRALHIPAANRCGWEELTQQVRLRVRQAAVWTTPTKRSRETVSRYWPGLSLVACSQWTASPLTWRHHAAHQHTCDIACLLV